MSRHLLPEIRMQGSPGPGAVALIAGAPRSAFKLTVLLPVWFWVLAAEAALRWLPAGIAPWATGSVLAVGFLPCAAWVSLVSACEGVANKPHDLRTMTRRLRRGLAGLFLAPAFTLTTPLLFAACALAVAVVGQVPIVGGWLSVLWMSTCGLVLAFLAAGWLVVGLPAIALQVVAAMTEFSDAMEIASRTLSYVRRRPLLLCLAWTGALASALLGTLVFAVFVALVEAMVFSMGEVGAGRLPGAALLWGRFRDLLAASVWLGDGVRAFSVGSMLLARLVPAFLVASVFAGGSRVYLLVRREIDDVPVSQVHEN